MNGKGIEGKSKKGRDRLRCKRVKRGNWEVGREFKGQGGSGIREWSIVKDRRRKEVLEKWWYGNYF